MVAHFGINQLYRNRQRAGVAGLPLQIPPMDALRFLSVLLLAAIGYACSLAGTPEASCESGAASPGTVIADLIAADNAGDIERVLELYADTVVWLPPDGEELVGETSIRLRYARLFRDFRPAIELEILETIQAGGLGVVRGRTHGYLQSYRSESTVFVDDKFLAVLACREQRWLITHLAWSPRSSEF